MFSPLRGAVLTGMGATETGAETTSGYDACMDETLREEVRLTRYSHGSG
jgi:hypothetical protein